LREPDLEREAPAPSFDRLHSGSPLSFSTACLRPYAHHLLRDQERIEARYKGCVIESAYQPIYSFAHARPVGFEGLARARDARGRAVPPLELLAQERSLEGTVFLDRLLRALHVANFKLQPFESAWLFLNVSPKVVVQGRKFGPFFMELLESFEIPPERVVVEIVESETSDEGGLENAAAYYRKMGCLLAIDDFGAGHSNFHRFWDLRPDIVKLDRQMVSQAARNPAAMRGLAGLVGLLHEIGSLVLAEGVETREEWLAVLDAEVDLLQGYLLQHPFVGHPPDMDKRELFDTLRRLLVKEAKDEEAEFRTALGTSMEAFTHAADRVARGEGFPSAVRDVLALKNTLRCFLLDQDGSQIGENLTAASGVARQDLRHEPLMSARGANWTHRHYFRRAISLPSKVQVSRPYLSLTDPQLCLTLSCAVSTGQGTVVLCCDLEYPLRNPSADPVGSPSVRNEPVDRP
jgi:EAL domain-containing protein (putative c-di-GMP-specific phosphodiesterase class I)